jgi:hypothetical protein
MRIDISIDSTDAAAGSRDAAGGPDETAAELARIVADVTPKLLALDPGAVGDGHGWSARQIVGHLIDSAANNHARFVRGQIEEDLVFEGYEQEEWVEVEGFDEEPWDELIELWAAYNRHLARVIARIDPLEWSRPRARHNFDRIGFASIEASRLGTLGWLVVDYVAHLRHHLGQLERLSRS